MPAAQRAPDAGPSENHRRHVIAENEGEQGDRPAVDHRRPCPGVQETRVATERPGQKMIVAARMRIRRGKFGVTERARQRHDGAQTPGHDQPADVAGDARHHRRRLEDAGADDDADDDRDRIGGTQQRPRCRRHDGGWGIHGLAPPAQRLLPVSGVFRMSDSVPVMPDPATLHPGALQSVLAVDEAEAQLVPVHPGAEQRLRLATQRERASEALVALHQVERSRERPAVVLERPLAADTGRDDPHKTIPLLDLQVLVRLPVAHVELVRSDARSRFHPENDRAQLDVELRQQVHRHHGRLGEILDEDVAGNDVDEVLDARALDVAPREFGHVGVVLDADGLGAVLLCRGDWNLAIARAQVVDDIVLAGLHGLEHPGDHGVRRRYPDHVLAGLTGRGLVGVLSLVGLDLLSGARQGEGNGDKREGKT